MDVDRELVEILAIGDHHTALAGRDDLVELETEAACVPERAKPSTLEGSAGGLAHVLDEGEPMAPGERCNRPHVGGGAAHVHGQDRPGARSQLTLCIARVERQRLIDLDEHGQRSRSQDGVRGGVPRVGGDEDLVPGTDPGSDESANERRGARVEAQCMARAHVGGELLLEEFDLLRPVSDPVVAEEVLASDHSRQRLELLLSDLHPPGEHGGLRPGARGRAAVAREPEPVGLDRHVCILDVWRPQSNEPGRRISSRRGRGPARARKGRSRRERPTAEGSRPRSRSPAARA